eukprot:CAMPEP_0119116102 /NCGR_PEP_ID=MMETSP1180-20130426/52100_1 /TAXON_ID=3052 ORGANISM="Chlamydomonas cf sp, Strain CCMP681" /NCGR_SAMPLE_ID=MMETSP1180 /ASSEMBLY_ACC=CAM_ASM_000741 /LENGTH=92 /DNA_ID=CAMNT_0007105217 /DNA_START=1212 /DNA_END=1490 /DNA_ORIENTATION=+
MEGSCPWGRARGAAPMELCPRPRPSLTAWAGAEVGPALPLLPALSCPVNASPKVAPPPPQPPSTPAKAACAAVEVARGCQELASPPGMAAGL